MSSDSSSPSSASSSSSSSPASSPPSSPSSSDSDCDEGFCSRILKSKTCALPFKQKNIENLILSISDRFDFRVILNDERTKTALLVTTGLTIAGGLIGRHYAGKIGAAVGGVVGGACGVGIVMVSMRSLWLEIKDKLKDLYKIVYDYLSSMGLEDYKNVGKFLAKKANNMQLAMIILEAASGMLGKKIISSFTSA